MLTLTRRVGERIQIGEDIEITVVSVQGGRVRVGVSAPRSLAVHRSELLERVREQNRAAVADRRPISSIPVGRGQDRDPLDDQSFETFAARVKAIAHDAHIVVRGGLFGFGEHERFVLCEPHDEDNPLYVLVSHRAPELQLVVLDVELAFARFPLEDAVAKATHHRPELADQEVSVVAILTVPASGAAPTANLLAPVVIGHETRTGVQIVLDDHLLPVAHPIGASPEADAASSDAASSDAASSDAASPDAASPDVAMC